MPARLNDKIIINDIKRVYRENGPVSSKRYYKIGNHSEATIINHFGSWKNIINQLNLEYVSKTEVISKEDLINDVMNVFNQYGNTTREFYLKHGKYSRAAINRIYGTWNAMLKDLNQPLNMRKQYDINKDEILQEMNSLYNQYGYLTAELQREKSTYSQRIIENVFGSFNNMLKELNIEPNCSGARFNDEELLQSIQSIYKEYGFISCELIERYCKTSLQTIYRRFESIKNVCSILNIPYENDYHTSKLAMRLLHTVNNYLNEKPICEYQFNWLINPRTKRKLRIDAFYPEHNLAIEIDGEQHYSDCDMFYKNSGFPLSHSLEVRQYLDSLKENLIKEHNIRFLRLTHEDGKKSTIQKLNQVLKG